MATTPKRGGEVREGSEAREGREGAEALGSVRTGLQGHRSQDGSTGPPLALHADPTHIHIERAPGFLG